MGRGRLNEKVGDEEAEEGGRRSGLAYGMGEGEVAVRGIVKIKNRRKRTRRRNGERALEKAVSKVWAAQMRARGLGEGGRGHPRLKPTARARTARVSFWGAASPAPLEAP